MDILQFLVNARDEIRRNYYLFKAKRAMRRSRAIWDAMSTEQQMEQRKVFLDFVDKVESIHGTHLLNIKNAKKKQQG